MSCNNSDSCIICLNSYKKPTKIFCGHTFCYKCIESWSSQSDKCPICRQKFNLEITHNYNTRQNYHIQNKELIINKVNEYLNDYIWLTMENEGKIIQFNKIFQYIYDNKSLLKYKRILLVTKDILNTI